ncbi:Hypothetical predicted protein [Octopus vulgaris]|uniref:Uncharacterized protein n=1 Tax=Octopus vulgaris TaxID=6645 RepID=A0AA36AHG5_OCTVU|nr:Hypothetical predicted protein [Octopus vulgaris]
MSLDSLSNYIQAMQPHIANTKVTTLQAHEEREKILSAHMMKWTIILGPQKRTANNFQAYKVTTDPVAGPPTRTVCGANIASNYRISYFLSMIIRPIIRMSPDVCDSTEDLLSRINVCNNTCDLTGCIVGNMDVVSLYPSIDVDFAVEKCVEMINESEVEFRNVNTEELGLLLRLTYDNEYLDKHDLSSFCPSRRLRGYGQFVSKDNDLKVRSSAYPEFKLCDKTSLKISSCFSEKISRRDNDKYDDGYSIQLKLFLHGSHIFRINSIIYDSDSACMIKPVVDISSSIICNEL